MDVNILIIAVMLTTVLTGTAIAQAVLVMVVLTLIGMGQRGSATAVSIITMETGRMVVRLAVVVPILVIATGDMLADVNPAALHVIHAFQAAKQHVLQATLMLITAMLLAVIVPVATTVGTPLFARQLLNLLPIIHQAVPVIMVVQ